MSPTRRLAEPLAPPLRPSAIEPEVDFDVHGAVGVRLVEAAPADVAAVARALGPPNDRGLRRDPDILVRFSSRIETLGWRSTDGERSGYTEDDFYVLDGRRGTRKARVPLDRLGGKTELLCESGVRSVPLLQEAVKLCALGNGLLPMHASAFEYRGTGVLVTGWPHGGKTAALLAFTRRGAALVGDDLVFLDADGCRVRGLATPVGVADWQLRQLPHAWSRLGTARRLSLEALHASGRLRAALDRPPGGGVGLTALRALTPALRRRLRTELSPETVAPAGHGSAPEPQTLFLMVTHAAAGIRVEASDRGETVQRLVQLARYDRLALEAHYAAFRFGFPARRNRFLERAHELEAERLRSALARVRCWTVHHPRPVSLHALYEAMEPFCEPPAAIAERRGSA